MGGDGPAWIVEKGLEPQSVKDSSHAWPSFLLGAATLFENEPTIQIGGLSLDGGAVGRRATGTPWEIRVAVKDGDKTASVDADKVAALFEGTRQIGDWTDTYLLPLSVTAKGTDGDTLLFDVTPVEESVPAPSSASANSRGKRRRGAIEMPRGVRTKA